MKQAIVKTLKERLKKVESENLSLREQIEVIYGRIVHTFELEQRIERMEKENLGLRKQLVERGSFAKSPKDSNSQPATSSELSSIDS